MSFVGWAKRTFQLSRPVPVTPLYRPHLGSGHSGRLYTPLRIGRGPTVSSYWTENGFQHHNHHLPAVVPPRFDVDFPPHPPSIAVVCMYRFIGGGGMHCLSTLTLFLPFRIGWPLPFRCSLPLNGNHYLFFVLTFSCAPPFTVCSVNLTGLTIYYTSYMGTPT